MPVVAISSLDPVPLEYNLDPDMGLAATPLHFSNGVTLYHTNILDSYLDITFNRDNVVLLTSRKHLATAVNDIGDSAIDFADYVGSTSITLTDGSGNWADVINVNGDGSKVFQLEYEGDKILILNDSGEYLTYFTGTQTIGFSAALIPDPDGVQRFIYSRDGDQMILNTSDATRTLYYDAGANEIRTTAIISETNPIEFSQVFKFTDFRTTGLESISATQSNWVVYNQGSNDITINHGKTYSDVKHNFLITAPYKTLDAAGLSVNIANLKNYQTADYDYYLGAAGPNAREYDKIITGINQEDGHENIYLGFNSGTTKVNLAKDKYTYFHFSTTVDTVALSATTFVDDGAIAGPSPWRADKIFKKHGGYPDSTNWGDSNVQDGVWFCAWLSGNQDPNVKPVWMDRYYDPIYTPESPAAITSMLLSAIDVSDIVDISNPVIWDTPSTLVFEAGGLYVYHHLGETAVANVVASLKANANLVADYSVWNSASLIDQSQSGYDGAITGFTLSANRAVVRNIKNAGYNISGTYAYVEKVDEVFNSDDITLSFWLNVDDWNNIKGDQIFGNYYDGGIGVFNNNPILTPYIGLYELDTGRIMHLNSNLEILNRTDTAGYASGTPIHIVRSTYDSSYFVLDSNQNILVYDIENILINVIDLNTVVPGISATHFALDKDLNFHVVDPFASPFTKYYIISKNGVLVSNNDEGDTGTNNKFAIDRDGNAHFAGLSGLRDVVVNSDYERYSIDAQYLYRGSDIIWQAASMQCMQCDMDDNIWLVYNYNKLAKIDKVNNLVSSATFPITSVSAGDVVVNISREITTTGMVEYVWVVDSRTQYIHKFDTSCNLISSTPISIPSLSGVTIYGARDNGYDYQRNFVAHDQYTHGLTVKLFLGDQYINGTDLRTSLQADVTNMSGPKHVTVTFSRSLGEIKFYIDGVVVDSENVEPFKYRISANRNVLSFVIGTNAGKREPLVTSLDQPGYYGFDGVIGDINIFNKALNVWDVKALSDGVRTNVFGDMQWNMPIGSRNFIEEIDRMFMHKMPGNKSQFFNIRLNGLNITDSTTREMIETSIKNVLKRINPSYASLYRIIWD